MSGEREYVDGQTAATVTVGAPVLVFAHERPELAVHARDYLTLVPVAVDRSGVRTTYFFGYAWSTIDKRYAGDVDDLPRFELVADGRRVALAPYSGDLGELGFGEPPLQPPTRAAQMLVALTSREAQQFIAGATELGAVLLRDGGTERFDLWSR